MRNYVLIGMLLVGAWGLWTNRHSFFTQKAHWHRETVNLGGRTASAEFPAPPSTTSEKADAELNEVHYLITAIADPQIGALVRTGTQASGEQIAALMARKGDGGQFVYKASGISRAGMTGVLLRAEGDGARGRGELAVVSDGNLVVAVGCATPGGLGLGDRLKQMNATCDRFQASLSVDR